MTLLSSRLHQQVDDQKDNSGSLNAALSNFTKKIKNLTRQMMAKVSELSMYQASAMELEREKTKKALL